MPSPSTDLRSWPREEDELSLCPSLATPVVFQDEVPLHRGCLVLILAAVAVAAYAHHGGRNVQVAKRTEEERGRVVIVIPLQAGGAVRSIFIRI